MTRMNTDGNIRSWPFVGASLADARDAETTGAGKQRPDGEKNAPSNPAINRFLSGRFVSFVDNSDCTFRLSFSLGNAAAF